MVYHANYLNFLERARTEFFCDRGLLVAGLAAAGHVFPVVRMEIDFIAPARHDDRLLVNAPVKPTCVGHDLKAHRIPLELRQVLNNGTGTAAG